MIHAKTDKQTKGWLVWPWNSGLGIPIGYANQGDEARTIGCKRSI